MGDLSENYMFRIDEIPSMPACKDCFHYTPLTREEGECRIIGKTEADRDKDRCPSRTFRPRS